MIKKFITWLTRPKITVFLNSGNVVRMREYPTATCLPTDTIEHANEVYVPNSSEFMSRRKWYQRWTKCL